jgi:thymidylate synthase
MIKSPNVKDIREYFINELINERFTIDKTGQKTIELIGASFLADESCIFGQLNEEYIQKELEWYNSMSTNINDIYGDEKEPPQAWKYSANKHGEINSNYGLLIYSEKYFNQFERVVDELFKNPDGRRAIMVYNRPSIWKEFNENGKSDFICTNAVTYYIRDGKLHAVVQMRSNDVIFGYKNDYAWQKHVMKKVCDDFNLKNSCDKTFGNILTVGDLYWQVQNLHVYQKHFHLVK